MGIRRGPNIIQEGLVLSLDAGNVRSYPGSGTTLVDLGSQKTNAGLVNSPTFNNAVPKNFALDGINDYIETPNMSVTSTRTVEVTYKLLSTGQSWGPLWRSDWKERIFPSNTVIINSNGTYYYLAGPQDNTNIVTSTYSYSGTSLKCYRNGALTDSQTMDGAMDSSTYYYAFGYQCGGSSCLYSNVQIYSVRMYNRQLSDTEVLQNFNMTKTRFGL